MLQIHGDSNSGNCWKVKWIAEFVGRPYRWVETSVLAGETRRADFLLMNPAGQVPLVVLDDGRALAESNAIMLYLAEGSALIPADAYDRARMIQWLFWEQYSHEPYIAVARRRVKMQGEPFAALEPRLTEGGARALARLESELGAREFLVGANVSLADVALVAYTRWAHEGGFDMASYPAVRAWIGRVEAALNIKA